MVKTVPAGILTTLVLAVGAAPSVAAGTDRSDFALGLSSQVPGTATGMTIDARYYAAGDRDAKPPPIRRVVVALPEGTRLNTAATPHCTATDEQLRLLGRAACPDGSEVGRGTVTAITGFGAPVDPVRADATVFNGGDELIELVSFPGTPITAGIDRLHIDGSVLSGEPPTTPGGPPDGQTTIRQVEFTIPAVESSAGSLITTPALCPPTGVWTSHGTFSFGDGATTSVPATTPCAPRSEPELRLTRRCGAGGRLHMTLHGDIAAVRDVSFKLGKRLVRRATQAPFARVLDHRTLARTGADRLRAVAYLHRGGRTILARGLPRCGA